MDFSHIFLSFPMLSIIYFGMNRGVIAELANNIIWVPLVPRLKPTSSSTFANMRNGSALVVWPGDAFPSTSGGNKLLRQAAAFNILVSTYCQMLANQADKMSLPCYILNLHMLCTDFDRFSLL